MRSFFLGILLVGVMAASARAASVKFPYEAVVEADVIYIRSGPGEKYYATGTLKKGARVIVQRHDPGQWFMIVPPPGSFSWIPGRYVQKTAAGRGQVTTNQVVVRVGSTESDIRDVEQRRLSKGDEVVILGEKNLTGEDGVPQLWYRIQPPKNEWRWMLGRYLVPVPQGGSQSGPGADPFDERLTDAHPAGAQQKSPGTPQSLAINGSAAATSVESYDPGLANGPLDDGELSSLVERPLVRRNIKPGADGDAVLQTGPTKSRLQLERAELDRLDTEYQAILDRDVMRWDFDEVERGYQQLRTKVSHVNFQHVIEDRLASIITNRKVRDDADEIGRLRRETEQRDAALADQQRKLEAQLASRSQPRFDGAGIVQHSTSKVTGAPRYVLLAPNGRVLSYLLPEPGVNLDPFVGRPAGVVGARSYRQDLSTDVIIVRQIAPVRLEP